MRTRQRGVRLLSSADLLQCAVTYLLCVSGDRRRTISWSLGVSFVHLVYTEVDVLWYVSLDAVIHV